MYPNGVANPLAVPYRRAIRIRMEAFSIPASANESVDDASSAKITGYQKKPDA